MAKNPEYSREQRSINQAQGPRTGNTGTPSKREKFITEKTGGFRTELADFVMAALEKRAPRDSVDPRVEPLDSDRGPKSNPTAGGTKYNVKTRAPGNTVKK